MAWIPDDQRDSSYYIFNEKFQCKVQYIDTRSADHIRMFGMPTSGIREIDAEATRERVLTYLTINQMVEYFKRGSIVGVVKKEDTKRIYDRITEHLVVWKNQLQFGMNNGEAPIDDLILLDQFANAVYEHAKYQFTNEIAESLLLRNMSSIIPVSRDSLLNSFKKNKPTDQPEESLTRKPMQDFFSTYQKGSTLKVNKWG